MRKTISTIILTLAISVLIVSAQNDLFQKGVQQYNSKQYEQAAETFKQVLAQSPREYPALYNLGLCYYFLKKYDLAAQTFQQVITIKADYKMGHYYLGSSQSQLNRYQEAVASFKKTIQLDPKFYLAWYDLGTTHNKLNEFSEAKKAFDEAIRLYPNFPEAYLGLGNSYYNDKNYLPSINFYKKALELSPGYSTASLYLADAYLNSKKYDLALETYKKTIALNSKETEAYFGLGLTYINLKNLPQARSQVAILRNLDPARASQLERLIGGAAGATPSPTPAAVPTPPNTVAFQQVPVPRTAQRIKDEKDVAAMQDFGFDGAIVTGVGSIRETPKATGKVLVSVKRGDILALSSRQPSGNFYQVVEEKSGLEGWIDAKSIVIKLTVNSGESGPPLEETAAVNSMADPIVQISNLEENTTLNMRINGTLYKIPPQSTKTLTVPAGKFTYYGWSPGIRPTSGSKTVVKGKQYTWRFKIFRR